MTDKTNKDLPPLPKPVKVLYIEGEECPIFGRGQMHAYARAALSASAPTAGSAPSDEEIQAVAESMRMQPWGIGSRQEDAIAYGRTLLAQYGSPAWQPIETAPNDGEVVLVRGHEFGNANLPRFVAITTYVQGEFHNEEGAQVKPDQWMRIDAEN